MSSQEALLVAIDETLARIRSHRPLNAGELSALQQSLQVEFTYNSNAIEGNTLTLGETKLLLEDGITIGGKTLREMHEALNHNEIFTLLYEAVTNKEEISEELIKRLHSFVLQNIDNENAGEYRQINVFISGEEELPPAPQKIPSLMAEFLHWSQQAKDSLHPALYAAELHFRFVKIHPFIDGNGRAVRVLINIILMQHGYPMIIIPVIRRGEYISTLNSKNTFEDFSLFFLDVVLQNLKDYERMIDPDCH